ncbi:MAG: hypothetical protein JO311_08170, partial [Candidatus Eremiobacteraeota bacterium]|nr:hypothetical protein [Candidatus Eremiobacteraeota bacterium]
MLASTSTRCRVAALLLACGLASCAGPSPNGAPVPPVGPATARVTTTQSAHQSSRGLSPDSRPKDLKDLYVSDFADNAVKILKNGTWRDAGVITAGINWPTGLFLDKRGNLYVANTFGANVTEYAPGAVTPSFTYSANAVAPYFVTADARGNVFVGDPGNGSASGQVYEYFQGFNATVAACTPGQASGGNAGVYGVAVDAQGDVFVDYRLPGGITGTMAEYPGGLTGCHQT